MRKISQLLLLFAASYAYSQTVEGNIRLKNNSSPAEGEIIFVKDKTKSAAITGSDGNYKIKLPEYGEYRVDIYYSGEKFHSESVVVKSDLTKNFEIDDKASNVTKIEGVTVSARKKLVERKVDRLVFNVENSVASQGTDAFEALGKTPMVRTTNDAISIAGKSAVSVMVNDRLLNISGDELINYLKTLRSDDIAKIEVITTPPAKYDAEGKSGLINIILKKNTGLGWNGSLQTSGNYYWDHPQMSSRNGVNFNYQSKKLSVSVNGNIGNNYWSADSYTHNTGTNSFWNTDGYNFMNYRYKGANLKSEYKINDKSTIGAGYNYSYSNPIERSKNITHTKDESGERFFSSESNNLNHRKNHYVNAFYELKLDSLNSKLTVAANLIANNADADNRYATTTRTVSESYANPVNRYHIYAAQADLEKNYAKLKTETGLKYTAIKNDAYFNFYDILNGAKVFNTDRSNDFFYNEENYAAYLSASYKFSDKWDAKAGLRYEYTVYNGISPNENMTAENSYGKLFPTAYISYKPNENNAFSANYSRRITRPYFGMLNPFRYYSSEYEYSTGNPYLRPTFADNFELSYVLKNNFTVTAYYTYNADDWDRIQRIDGDTKYDIMLNFYNNVRTGVGINYNFTKLKWLESNLNANAFYTKSNNFIPDVPGQLEGYGAFYNIDNTFFLKKDKTLSFSLGAWGNTASKTGNTLFAGNIMVYSGLKMSLLEKNLLLNLLVDDVFRTMQGKGTEYYHDYKSDYFYSGKKRTVNLSVTYKFGNNNVKGATKQLQFDEQDRAK